MGLCSEVYDSGYCSMRRMALNYKLVIGFIVFIVFAKWIFCHFSNKNKRSSTSLSKEHVDAFKAIDADNSVKRFYDLDENTDSKQNVTKFFSSKATPSGLILTAMTSENRFKSHGEDFLQSYTSIFDGSRAVTHEIIDFHNGSYQVTPVCRPLYKKGRLSIFFEASAEKLFKFAKIQSAEKTLGVDFSLNYIKNPMTESVICDVGPRENFIQLSSPHFDLFCSDFIDISRDVMIIQNNRYEMLPDIMKEYWE